MQRSRLLSDVQSSGHWDIPLLRRAQLGTGSAWLKVLPVHWNLHQPPSPPQQSPRGAGCELITPRGRELCELQGGQTADTPCLAHGQDFPGMRSPGGDTARHQLLQVSHPAGHWGCRPPGVFAQEHRPGVTMGWPGDSYG